MDESTLEWLLSLQKSTESECLSTLSAKNVATNDQSLELLVIRQSHLAVKDIRRESDRIIDTIDHFIDNCLPIQRWQRLEQIHDNCLALMFDKIHSVVELCRRHGCDYRQKSAVKVAKCLSQDVWECCQQFTRFVRSFVAKRSVNNPQLEATLRKLKEQFGELVDQTIKSECHMITESLKSRNSYLAIKWSLVAYMQLTRADAYICRALIESKDEFIPMLMDLIVTYWSHDMLEVRQIKAAALTVMTNLCANHSDAVQQVLHEFLANKSLIQDIVLNDQTSDLVLRQAIQLLVQLTKHFIDYSEDHNNNNSMSFKMCGNDDNEWQIRFLAGDLVNCLTQLVRHQPPTDRHLFLMVTTVLANVSFIYDTNQSFIKSKTLSTMLSAVRESSDRQLSEDLAIKDQLITILANIGRKYPEEVVACNGLVYVLCALQVRPPSLNLVSHTTDALAVLLATERVQQKCCVCLARLAADRSVAKLIVRLSGVNRLVELCKEAKERNFSDTVLLAGIVCVRKLSQSVGRGLFKALDATDLIDPKVNETFCLYSEKNETIV